MHLTKHATALDKNIYFWLQLRFLYQTSYRRYTKTPTFRNLLLLQHPIQTIQHNSTNDAKSLVTETGVFQRSPPGGTPPSGAPLLYPRGILGNRIPPRRPSQGIWLIIIPRGAGTPRMGPVSKYLMHFSTACKYDLLLTHLTSVKLSNILSEMPIAIHSVVECGCFYILNSDSASLFFGANERKNKAFKIYENVFAICTIHCNFFTPYILSLFSKFGEQNVDPLFVCYSDNALKTKSVNTGNKFGKANRLLYNNEQHVQHNAYLSTNKPQQSSLPAPTDLPKRQHKRAHTKCCCGAMSEQSSHAKKRCVNSTVHASRFRNSIRCACWNFCRICYHRQLLGANSWSGCGLAT